MSRRLCKVCILASPHVHEPMHVSQPRCRDIVISCGVSRPSSWAGTATVPTSSCAVMVRSVCSVSCSRQSCGNRAGAPNWPGHKVRHKVLLRFWGVGGLEGVFGVWGGVLPCVSLSRFRSTPVGERRIYGLQRKTINSEVSYEIRHSRRRKDFRIRSVPTRRARVYGLPKEIHRL